MDVYRLYRLRGNLLILHSSLTRGGSQVGVWLCSQGTRDKTKRNGLELHQHRFSLDTREKFFP